MGFFQDPPSSWAIAASNDEPSAVRVESPSSRTGLLPSSPLRTVHESFLSHSSSPSNASFGETRFRDRGEPGHGTPDEVDRGSPRFANHPSYGQRSGAGASPCSE